MAWVVRNLISTQVYAPAPAGPTSSLELRAARGRLAEDSAFILTNRSHPTALRRASVTERALYFTAAVQAVGASERTGEGLIKAYAGPTATRPRTTTCRLGALTLCGNQQVS